MSTTATRRGRLPRKHRPQRPRPHARRGWRHYVPARQKRRQAVIQAAQRATRPRRRRPRRGALFAILSVAVAGIGLSLVLIEAVSTVAALELAFAAETVAGGLSWWLGDRKPATAAKPSGSKRPAGQGYIKGSKCGAPCADKTSCNNPVRHGQTHCHYHGGGGGGSGGGSNSGTKPGSSRNGKVPPNKNKMGANP